MVSILILLVLMGMPVGDSSDVVAREPNPSTLRYYSGQAELRIGASSWEVFERLFEEANDSQ